MTTSEQNHRLPGRGDVDRDSPLTFDFDGRTVHGFRGDTLASALLANGIHEVATSITRGRPRGVVGAGAEDPTAVLQIDTPFPEPMQQATLVELAPGIRAHGIPGQGRLADLPDPARYDTAHLHVDVLVVGAGPSGLVAAWTAARSGARVALVDDQPRAGLSLAGETRLIDGVDAARWADRVTDELVNHPGHDVTHLQRTTVFGTYDDNLALAVERRTTTSAALRNLMPSASASGGSGRRASSWRPGPMSVRSPSATTTVRASCSPVPPVPTCTVTGSASAMRWSSSPPTTARTPSPSTCTTPERGSRRSSTRAPPSPTGGRTPCGTAASP